VKTLRKEILEILSNKLSTAIEAFEAQRNSDLKELVTFKKIVKNLETEKENIQNTMANLNTKRVSDLGEYNRLTQKLNWLSRQLKGKKSQIDALMGKLTELEVNPKMLSLLLTFKAHGGKDEEG